MKRCHAVLDGPSSCFDLFHSCIIRHAALSYLGLPAFSGALLDRNWILCSGCLRRPRSQTLRDQDRRVPLTAAVRRHLSTGGQFYNGEPSGSGQRVQTIASPGQWGIAFVYDVIQRPLISAETEVSIPTPDDKNGPTLP